MSAVLSTVLSEAAHAVDPAAATRHCFPVGARFPRRTLDQELASLAEVSRTVVTSSPVFPVGARFPRRTPAEVQAYLASSALITAAPARGLRPVGARFPLR